MLEMNYSTAKTIIHLYRTQQTDLSVSEESSSHTCNRNTQLMRRCSYKTIYPDPKIATAVKQEETESAHRKNPDNK